MPLEEIVESLKFQFSSAMKFKNKNHLRVQHDTWSRNHPMFNLDDCQVMYIFEKSRPMLNEKEHVVKKMAKKGWQVLFPSFFGIGKENASVAIICSLTCLSLYLRQTGAQ